MKIKLLILAIGSLLAVAASAGWLPVFSDGTNMSVRASTGTNVLGLSASMLASTNVWTGPQTNNGPVTFNGPVVATADSTTSNTLNLGGLPAADYAKKGGGTNGFDGIAFSNAYVYPGGVFLISSATITNSEIFQLTMNDNAANTTVTDATAQNSVTQSGGKNTSATHVAGKVNGALSQDGTADYINVPSSAILNSPSVSLSISVWFKFVAFPSTSRSFVLKTIPPNGADYYMWINMPDKTLYLGSLGGTGSVAGGTLATNTWYHCVLIWSSGNYLKAYLNNSLLGTDVTPGTISSSATALTLGLDSTYGYSNVVFDDSRLWSRILTPAEVAYLYNSAAGSEGTSLTATYVGATGTSAGGTVFVNGICTTP